MEAFKFLVAAGLSPLLITIVVQMAGWCLWRRRRRLGLGLLAAGTCILLLGSLGGWTYEQRRQGEFRFAPLQVSQIPAGPLTIVVLGTGFNPDPLLPANSQVGGAFLARLLEGVRLWRARPDAQLVVSIAGTAQDSDKRRFFEEIAVLLDLRQADRKLLTAAESTLDEANQVKPLAEGRTVLLATSAGHMPRAMQIFAGEGMRVLAAPTDFSMVRAGSPRDRTWLQWLPSVEGLGGNHAWLYEATAGLWQRVRKAF